MGNKQADKQAPDQANIRRVFLVMKKEKTLSEHGFAPLFGFVCGRLQLSVRDKPYVYGREC
jgi:hypothetical protein